MGILDLSEGEIRARNEQNFTTHAAVGKWYDKKYEAMGGCWVTPERDLDRHLDLLTGPGVRGLQDASILDMGCGDGSLLARAVSRGAIRLVGIDLSGVALGWAEGLFESLQVPEVLYQFDRVPMEQFYKELDRFGGPFDYAISLGSMEHALDIPKAVRSMAKSLRPGGEFLLYCPNEDWTHEDQPLETCMTGNQWKELCEDAGLVVTTVRRSDGAGNNNWIIGYRP